jgi:predicted transcriptional regulator
MRLMRKTTVYLPEDLKMALEREAQHRGVTEAEVIRQAIAAVVERPTPTEGLFASEEPIASRSDELLAGFGR